MTYLSRCRGWRAAAAVTVALAALTAAAPAGASSTTPAARGPAVPAARMVRDFSLTPMPSGSARLGRDRRGRLTATISGFGFTPGSPHAVLAVRPLGGVLTTFSVLTAGTGGQAAGVVLSSGFTGQVPFGTSLAIRNGTGTSRVSREVIARSGPLAGAGMTARLTAVAQTATGQVFGPPQGVARIVDNPRTRTISVTVTATGMTPGLHAAHIHVGSCQNQGPVTFMLGDYRASRSGMIISQTRVVTGVTAPIPPSGWYLNLHLGSGSQITNGSGQPTIFFRPMLCRNIR